MSDKVQDALEVCLSALEAGADQEAVLALFPDQAQELKPLLDVAVALRRVVPIEPSPDAMRRSRAALLIRAEPMQERRRGLGGIRTPRVAFAALGIALLLFGGGWGLVAASAQALPGEGLYPVKRTIEKVSLNLAPNASLKGSMASRYRERRLDETRSLLSMGLEQAVSFEGVLREIGEDHWLVDDIRVVPGPGAWIDPGLDLGVAVEVTGLVQQEGWVLANRVRLRAYLLKGRVESIAADEWIISGARLRITPLTLIDSRLAVGDVVLALVRLSGDSGPEALAMLLEEPRASASLPSEGPTASDTPAPTPEEEGGKVEIEVEASETPKPKKREEEETPKPTEESKVEETPKEDKEEDKGGEAEKEEIEFAGVVEAIGSSSWVIDGLQVLIDEETEIKDDPEVGDAVKVKAAREAGGPWIAKNIEKED